MKKLFSAVVGIAALVSTGLALAAGPWSNSVLISSVEADSIAGGNGTETYLAFTTTPTGKPGCGSATQYLMTGSPDHVKSMTALATSAFLAGRNVRVYWTGSCSGSYAQFSHLTLQ